MLQEPTPAEKPKEKVRNAHAMLKSLPPPPIHLQDKTGKQYTSGPWLGEVLS